MHGIERYTDDFIDREICFIITFSFHDIFHETNLKVRRMPMLSHKEMQKSFKGKRSLDFLKNDLNAFYSS